MLCGRHVIVGRPLPANYAYPAAEVSLVLCCIWNLVALLTFPHVSMQNYTDEAMPETEEAPADEAPEKPEDKDDDKDKDEDEE